MVLWVALERVVTMAPRDNFVANAIDSHLTSFMHDLMRLENVQKLVSAMVAVGGGGSGGRTNHGGGSDRQQQVWAVYPRPWRICTGDKGAGGGCISSVGTA